MAACLLIRQLTYSFSKTIKMHVTLVFIDIASSFEWDFFLSATDDIRTAGLRSYFFDDVVKPMIVYFKINV